MQCVELAGAEAVQAIHAAAIIDLVIRHVYTRSLAAFLAELAALALVGVYHRAEHREARQETQCRAHRADRVAVLAPVPPRQHAQHHEGHRRHNQGGQALQPNVAGIESVAVVMLGNLSQQVVTPQPERLQQVADHTPVGTVWRQHCHQHVHAENERQHEHSEYRVAQPFTLGLPSEAQPLAAACTFFSRSPFPRAQSAQP